MICAICGGPVEWQGPLTNLSHTKCLTCGSINVHVIEDGDVDEVEVADG